MTTRSSRTWLVHAAYGICSLAAGQAMGADSTSAATLGRISVTGEFEDVAASPYRTGGDVDVVTREEIEDAHYQNIAEAIRKIPGVQVSGPGYRASEYGFTFGDEVSINGDSSVVILVDGRRIDIDANSYGPTSSSSASSKTRVPLDVVTNIYNVERIEVIKGTGGVAYGAEATGGVINIVTRKGTDNHQTSAGIGLGSWNKKNYSLTQAGSFSDRSFRYLVTLNDQRSGDTRYKDAYLDKTVTYANTGYRDDGASLKLSREFTPNQEVSLLWSWTDGKAHYPITAPDYQRIGLLYGNQQPSSSAVLGYRNWFLYDAWLGSYTASRSNDVNLRYTFNKANGVESYVSLYRNYRRYTSRDYAGLFGTQYGNITPAATEQALRAAGNRKLEVVDGVDLQLAHTFGSHSLMTGWTYRESEYEAITISNNTHSFVNRDKVEGYLQDKIALTKNWTVTPGARFSDYTDVKRTSTTNVVTTRDGTDKTTFAAYTQYQTGLFGDLYASWAQIFRPKTNNDYNAEVVQEPLFDEKGASWTVGLRKRLGDATAVDVNWALTDMSNAIKRYSVYDPSVVNTGSPTGFGNFVNRSVNAESKSKALNIGVDHRFNDNWSAKASYAYVMERFNAKNYSNNPNDTTNVNSLINRFRPANTYQASALYSDRRWYASLNAQLLTGINKQYFTDDRFLVLGGAVNYDLLKNTRLYVTADNLTNEAWENKGHPLYGPGAFPQPSRSFLVGVDQKF